MQSAFYTDFLIMDVRREPRFSIYGPIKVTLLSSPERELDAVLLDISATGLKLIASESLAVDEIVSIAVEDHLALADVRYSQPRGDKFTIGCERIHLLNKVSLPNEKSRIEQIRLLIEDYRNRIRTGMATERPDTNQVEAVRLDVLPPLEKPPAAEQTLPSSGSFATREQLLDAAAVWVLEHWEKMPASTPEGTVGRSEIMDRLTIHLAEKLPAQMPPPAMVPAVSSPPAAKIPVKTTTRRWRLPAGVAAAAILGWGLSALFWSLGSSGAASRLPTSIAALISPKPVPPPVPAPSVRHAQIKVVEPTWVIATSDGKRLFNKKLSNNDVREIEFSDKALLSIGNAKGVEISLDGTPLGPIGGRGQARIVELTANGFRLLPLN